MRLLNMVGTLPYPPRSGGDLRAWHLCDCLSAHVEVTLLCRAISEPPAAHVQPFGQRGIDLQTVLVPRPSRFAKFLKGACYAFRPCPFTFAGWDWPAMRKRLHELVAARDFDVIVINATQAFIYLPLIMQSPALKVINLYDLVGEYMWRRAQLQPTGLKKLMMIHDAATMTRIEKRVLTAADLILVPSQREKDVLLARNDALKVAVVPNGVDCDTIQPFPPSERREILYVGSMRYYPNVDAVRFFTSRVWPLLRERFPRLIFRVIGHSPPPEIQRMHARNGIRIMGGVDSVAPYYRRAAVCAVPLRVGGGTRLKILEALAYARPVVSTTLGCEGLDTVDNKHLLVADDPADIAAQITRLLTDPMLTSRLCTAGRVLVEAQYAWPRIADNLRDVLMTARAARAGREPEGNHAIPVDPYLQVHHGRVGYAAQTPCAVVSEFVKATAGTVTIDAESTLADDVPSRTRCSATAK